MNGLDLPRRTRRVAPFLAVSALVLATPLNAQEPPLGAPAAPAAPDRECVCAWDTSAPRMVRSLFRFNRARIGAELGDPAVVGSRTGIRLRDVVEGGPAERAGIRAGDVVLSLDGTELGEEPADRLLDLLADVEPGDTVTVVYSRDGRDRTARVVTDRGERVSVFGPGDGGFEFTLPRMDRRMGAVLAPDVRVQVRHLLGDGVELVPMNEGLGEYFDVDEGVLVTSVDAESRLGLQAGDVIVSIAGRPVQDPAHARAIVGSYRPDETISFEIVRERRRMTVTGTRDEAAGHWRTRSGG